MSHVHPPLAFSRNALGHYNGSSRSLADRRPTDFDALSRPILYRHCRLRIISPRDQMAVMLYRRKITKCELLTIRQARCGRPRPRRSWPANPIRKAGVSIVDQGLPAPVGMHRPDSLVCLRTIQQYKMPPPLGYKNCVGLHFSNRWECNLIPNLPNINIIYIKSS
jgi:hypothetical protein